MCRTARRREWSVPVFALLISFSTKGRSSLALASVVSIAPFSMSDVARLRSSARRCSLVRRSCRPAFLCRIELLLHVVRCGRGRTARWRAGIQHANRSIRRLFEPHAEIQFFALEEIGDFLKRLLAEVLDLQNLTLRLPDQIAQAADVRVLERVHRADRQLEIVDGGLEDGRQALTIGAHSIAAHADRSRR